MTVNRALVLFPLFSVLVLASACSASGDGHGFIDTFADDAGEGGSSRDAARSEGGSKKGGDADADDPGDPDASDQGEPIETLSVGGQP